MEKEKSMLYRALSVFLVVVAVLALYVVVWGPLAQYGASLMPSQTLSASATGEVVVKPDIATVTFSVISEGVDIASIVDKNNQKVNEAIARVKAKGIPEADIKTAQYSLEPVYTQPTKWTESFVPSIASYRLTQSVEVKIRDFTLISPILTELPGVGINQVSGPSFGIDDPEKYLSEARKQAFDRAREKASSMALQNSLRLVRVITVSESGGPVYYSGLEKAAMYGMGGGSAPTPPTIEPGSQKVTAYVTVLYEVR